MQKSVSLLDLMTAEERRRVEDRKKSEPDAITREWMAIAELGFYFGYEAIKDVIEDVITLEQAHALIRGARKIHSSHIYDQAVAGLAANSTKKGAFEKLMKSYVRDMKDVK